MKKIAFAFLPLLLAGFVLPDDSCKQIAPPKSDYTGQYDGPYVFYNGELLLIKYVLDDKGEKSVITDTGDVAQKANISLTVATDEPGKTFSFKLKKKLQGEKSEYKKVSKQFVVSDIEGNFRQFRKLLQANGVIDSSFNWTFGEGHLVLAGDFFDRGNQVTEVLWLVYSLEEKAKEAGGYVHFVLGNHEIMNMNGDLRYVNKKYLETAELFKTGYEALYNENTELGRWLRTKNVVEKIGDQLYMHAGISPEMNRMDISISSINELSRPFYSDTTYNYPDLKLDTIFSDAGPFWYRGYYKAPKISQEEVDFSISKFGVKHIVTGHTMVSDTISIWYNNKVINTDVHHAVGKSEALLVDGGNYYRVNTVGEKFLMMSR